MKKFCGLRLKNATRKLYEHFTLEKSNSESLKNSLANRTRVRYRTAADVIESVFSCSVENC